MNRLISTWPRRLGVSLAAMVLAAVLILAATIHQSQQKPDVLEMRELMIRLLMLPALFAFGVFMLSTSWALHAQAASPEQGATSPADAAAASAKPFMAQVVGLEWLNPLQRRDYPTEWQTLWTLGLVKPNRNDDMVRAEPENFTSVMPVAGIANGLQGTETFKGFHQKYILQLLLLFSDRYVMNPHYFYTVASDDKHQWRELAGIHVEYAIPAGRLDAEQAGGYLRQQIIEEYNIGNPYFKSLWSKNTPPDVHVTTGGPNAGFASLNAALDYLETHPTESVWVMNWDAPSFPPKDQQINENMVLLILAGPQFDTGRDPLAWIGRVVSANAGDFEAKIGTTRAAQAWQVAIEAATRNAGRQPGHIGYVIHDVGRSSTSSDRLVPLIQTLTSTIPEFDYTKQAFDTPALLGEMGAGTALTDVVLAIGRANHLGDNVLVAGTTDPANLSAVMVIPPEKPVPIDPEQDWFRARGENNAYLPWWGRRRGRAYPIQGFTE